MTTPEDSAGTLAPGQEVRIVKLRPDGSEAASYDGVMLERKSDWIVTRAVWEFGRMDLGYMLFEPNDYLLEYFSTEKPFNAFALFSPAGDFKGWYCNVTHPATVQGHTIYWHDLYVDVVRQPGGKVLILDEDELEETSLHLSYPELYRMILAARDSVVEKMREGRYPFSEVDAAIS